MTETGETRHVVRLACGHEALQVVRGDQQPTPVGDRILCEECGRNQLVAESFEIEP